MRFLLSVALLLFSSSPSSSSSSSLELLSGRVDVLSEEAGGLPVPRECGANASVACCDLVSVDVPALLTAAGWWRGSGQEEEKEELTVALGEDERGKARFTVEETGWVDGEEVTRIGFALMVSQRWLLN